MKAKTIVFWSLFLLIFSTACEKKNTDISYPAEGIYGTNIFKTDSVDITASGNYPGTYIYYSMRAELASDASLKIMVKRKSGDILRFSSSSNLNWSVDAYDDSTKIYAFGQSVCDMKVYFQYRGSAEIEFYENGSSTPTRTKTIAW